MDLKFFEEQVCFATVLIQAFSQDGRSCTGTGFVVFAEVPNLPGHTMTLLVTCKHCLFGKDGMVSFRMHRKRPGNEDRPDFDNNFNISPSEYANLYFEHDDPEVDVAVINLSRLFVDHPEIFIRTVGLHHFSDFTHELLLPGRDVVFIGYPLGLFDTKHNLPIMRSGKLASIPKVDFNGKPEFLIDAQVFSGSSGSPVFVNAGRNWQFIGIVGKNLGYPNQVELVNTPPNLAVRQPIGLGIVYKPKAVLDVMEKAFEAARRYVNAAALSAKHQEE